LLAARGRLGGSPARAAAPSAIPAVEEPATLVPLTLRPQTPEADDVLANRLMGFSIALDQASSTGTPGDLPAAEAALLADDVHAALGPGPAEALRSFVAIAKASSKAPPLDQASVTAIDVATARLDNALLAARLPYFVDTSVMTNRTHGTDRRIIILYEFSIASSNLYASGASRVRAVRVRRLDRLNWKHTALGFVNPHRAQAAVLLDQVDEQLVRNILPALAEGAPMPLVTHDDDAAKLGPALAGITVRAGELARAELGALPAVDPAVVRDLGALLRQRRDLYEKWNGHHLELSIGVRVPSGLPIDMTAFERDLGERVAADDLAALKSVQAQLERPAIVQTYTVLRDAFADSVERHEVQHRLDLLRPLPLPGAVETLVRGNGRVADDLRDAVKNELSGYIAQIARDERTPRTTLTMLVRFLVNPRTRSSTEGFVAVIAAEELAAELGIRGVAPITAHGRLDEARLARAHRELTSVPPSMLAAAARKVWSRLFERELDTLSLIPPPTHEPVADPAAAPAQDGGS
jgi:hypothetical protein